MAVGDGVGKGVAVGAAVAVAVGSGITVTAGLAGTRIARGGPLDSQARDARAVNNASNASRVTLRFKLSRRVSRRTGLVPSTDLLKLSSFADVRTKLPVESLQNCSSIFASGRRGPARELRRAGGAGLDRRPG